MVNNDLINPATLSMMKARRKKLTLWLGVIFVPVFGGLAGGYHYEEPFLPGLLGLCPPEVKRYNCDDPVILDIAFGLLGGLLGLLYFVVLSRFMRVRSTITCLTCKGAGWIFDLEPMGACPRCGGRRFDAKIWKSGIAAGMTWAAPTTLVDVDGDYLVVRMRANKQGFM